MDQLANDLAISGRTTSLTIKRLNGEFTSNSIALEGLKVASISGDNSEWLPLPRTFTRPDVPVDNDDITKPFQLRKWKQLENVTDKLTLSCNQIAVNQADTKEVGRHIFQVKKEVKENDLPDMPKQIYNHEFSECQHLVNKDFANMSREDLKFV